MIPDRPQSLPRAVLALALLFAFAGIMHFVVPGPFIRIVPAWVPSAAAAVYVSGVAELAGAAGLLSTALRPAAAWGLILLLVSVFPANVQMLQLARHAHAASWYVAALWIRLPIQPLLIWWLWKACIRRT